MDGWKDEWMDGWIDGWVDGQMDGWICGWTDEKLFEPVLSPDSQEGGQSIDGSSDSGNWVLQCGTI